MNAVFLRATVAALSVAMWQPGTGAALELVDASGKLTATGDTSRILSIGSDTTEILYALGLGDKIVAIDSTSQYPADVRNKPNVGYMRALATEGVLSTGATLIVAGADAGPPDVVRALKASPVSYVSLPPNERAETVAEKIRLVGRVVGQEAKASDLAGKVDAGFASLATEREKITKPMRAIFVLGVTNGRALVGGRGSTADLVLKLAGAQNAADEIQGYKPMSPEALVELAPDVVVTMTHSSGEDVASKVAGIPTFAATPAGKNKHIITMNAVYLLGFGPRTPDAARELMQKIYAAQPG